MGLTWQYLVFDAKKVMLGYQKMWDEVLRRPTVRCPQGSDGSRAFSIKKIFFSWNSYSMLKEEHDTKCTSLRGTRGLNLKMLVMYVAK